MTELTLEKLFERADEIMTHEIYQGSINPDYIRRQAAIYESTPDESEQEADALWRIASHLQGVVQGLEDIGTGADAAVHAHC
ncbi:MAG: hypothetical protein AAGA75_25365 [Cyanobacteria bacterium P01_E01_bin.6]